jgi:hypothetical protein
MLKTVTEFYVQFLELVEKGTYLSVLRFELLELIPRPDPICISYNDQANFQAFKQFVFSSFVASIRERPSLDKFRVVVTSPSVLPSSNTNITNPPTSIALSNTQSIDAPAIAQTLKDHASDPLYTGLEQNISTRNSPPLLSPQIVVLIQTYGSRHMSKPYPMAVLGPKVKTVEFFNWFMKETGFSGPIGPRQLMVSFQDAFPTPKRNLITRGNEEHFEYMKRDIKPMCDHAALCMPGLTKFAILITLPGWVIEIDEE